MRWSKPVRPELGAFAVASFTATIVNAPFWRQLYAAVAPRDAYEVLFLGAVLVVALSLLTLFFQLLMGRRTFKPLATALLLVSSAAAYFISEYGIVVDAGMITNVIESNPAETADLLTRKLLAYVVATGRAAVAAAVDPHHCLPAVLAGAEVQGPGMGRGGRRCLPGGAPFVAD